ncbi:NAD(P)/FAD-dependent oxidoreductase [Roseococcus sp. DSY-14]|uniref:NAD(P)/FAD-dependent oxidoreductase n=1 Tax=Roseococcus sp. DSY-14 TaxID=3369650 RepID=UPI00387B7160
MSPPVDRIPSDERLPEAADVVIIGGGIIGVSAALHLARQGRSVALLEKGHVGAEQSSRNWGWCRVQGRDPQEIPLAQASLRLWGDMNEVIGAEAGFRRTGIIRATRDPAQMAEWEGWADEAQGMQQHTRVLSAAEVKELLPGNAEAFIGGLHTPTDGRAEPAMAAPAIAAGARRMGNVSIHQDCAARGLETTGGRVSAVVTEKGRIRADAVILSGGAWSSLFLKRHGVKLPAAVVNATAFRTVPGPEITEGNLATKAYCVRRRLDGGYTVALSGVGTLELTPDNLLNARAFWPMYLKRRENLRFRVGGRFLQGMKGASWAMDAPSPFEAERVRDPAPDPALVERALSALRAAYPGQRIEVAEAWGGAIDSTPDAVPVISPCEGLPGVVLATGFSGHGFGIGPAAGTLAANLATGEAPIVDPAPFRHARFLSGEPIRPSRSL